VSGSHEALHVKICGVTRIVDVELALDAGADLIGLNFVHGSPRRLDVARARALADAARGRATIVGVVADESQEAIEALVAAVGLDRVQLHGDEPPELVTALAPRAFKAIRVGSAEDASEAARFPGEIVLVDARVTGKLGGTGVRVDPAFVAPIARARCVLLAGGLGPESVAEAVRLVRPWGVDVASGVESAAGIEDERAVRAFVAEARRAAREVIEQRGERDDEDV